jgi:hypothetical protein
LFKRGFAFDMFFDRRLIESGQPLDDVLELLLGSAFFLDLGDVMGVNGRKRHLGNAFVLLAVG